MEGGYVNFAHRGSCCAECHLGWLVSLRSKSCRSAGNLASGEEVPEGNWFDSVHSALEFCFLGTKSLEERVEKIVCSSRSPV